MKLAWVSFLLVGLSVQLLMAQDQESLAAENAINSSPPPNMGLPGVSNMNQMKPALDGVLNMQDMQNGIKQLNSSNPIDTSNSIILGDRDPFQRPKYIDDLEMGAANKETIEDDRVEAIRRWPLREYRATAIMWDISAPKVMITDRRGTLHLLKKNYRIGNRSGIVTSINEGEIIVTENGMPVVMKIEAPSTK